jgi:hypothetical protein
MAKVRDWEFMTEDDVAEIVRIPRQSMRRWDDED